MKTKKSTTFSDLIDRLQICSAINHPDRPWSDESKVNISFAWIGKETELKAKVENLEKAIRDRKDE